MTMRHLDYLDHILTGEYPIDFREHQNRLYIYADMEKDFNDGDFILIECYRKLNPDTYTDVWKDRWLLRYAACLIKIQWGSNLTKFEGMQLPGGVQFNGQKIYDDAIAERQQLEEEMATAYSYPPEDMVG